jgi:hypothetical protein
VQPQEPWLTRVALRCCDWAERWFPDAFVFAATAVGLVTLAALGLGAPFTSVSTAFGDGFWSLIPFTMQMSMIVIGGYIVASAPPVMRCIEALARVPGSAGAGTAHRPAHGLPRRCCRAEPHAQPILAVGAVHAPESRCLAAPTSFGISSTRVGGAVRNGKGGR